MFVVSLFDQRGDLVQRWHLEAPDYQEALSRVLRIARISNPSAYVGPTGVTVLLNSWDLDERMLLVSPWGDPTDWARSLPEFQDSLLLIPSAKE